MKTNSTKLQNIYRLSKSTTQFRTFLSFVLLIFQILTSVIKYLSLNNTPPDSIILCFCVRVFRHFFSSCYETIPISLPAKSQKSKLTSSMLNVRPPKLDMTSSSLKSATRFLDKHYTIEKLETREYFTSSSSQLISQTNRTHQNIQTIIIRFLD